MDRSGWADVISKHVISNCVNHTKKLYKNNWSLKTGPLEYKVLILIGNPRRSLINRGLDSFRAMRKVYRVKEEPICAYYTPNSAGPSRRAV